MQQHFHQCKTAAVVLQSCVRRVQSRTRFMTVVRSIVAVQCATRVFLSRQVTNTLRQTRDLVSNSATIIAAVFRGHVERQRFVSFRTAVVQVQTQFRRRRASNCFRAFLTATKTLQANIRGKVTRRNIRHQHAHASRMQASIRRHLRRQEFGRAKRAAIRIQCARRCVVSRSTYKHVRATVLVQKCARKWIAMAMLSTARRASTLIQSHTRRRAAHQQHRAKCTMSTRVARLHRTRSQRSKYLQYRSAVLSLQTTRRRVQATKTLHRMKQEAAYSIAHRRAMEKSAKKIQSTYRTYLAYKKATAAAATLQTHARVFLKRMRCVRIQRSIGFVQSFWRGCIARSRSSKALNEMKLRVQLANENAKDEMKLGNRTSSALHVLLQSKALSEVFEAIKTLEVSTRLSSVCCSCFAQEIDAIPIIYGLMRSCNRSQPHRKLLLHALRVLNNVWPYEMKIARGNDSNIAPAFEPRMEILVDLMQVRLTCCCCCCCCCCLLCVWGKSCDSLFCILFICPRLDVS